VDRIVGTVMNEMVDDYNKGYYEDTFSAKWGRFKQWAKDTFSEYKRDEVVRFYLPQYQCLNSADYGHCMKHFSTWKPPEIKLKKKE
jgi:hypothetical protein